MAIYALDVGLLADVERESVGVGSDVGRGAICANAVVGQRDLVARIGQRFATADQRASIQLGMAPIESVSGRNLVRVEALSSSRWHRLGDSGTGSLRSSDSNEARDDGELGEQHLEVRSWRLESRPECEMRKTKAIGLLMESLVLLLNMALLSLPVLSFKFASQKKPACQGILSV